MATMRGSLGWAGSSNGIPLRFMMAAGSARQSGAVASGFGWSEALRFGSVVSSTFFCFGDACYGEEVEEIDERVCNVG